MPSHNAPKIAFVGAGFASAVLARELAERGDYEITVFESRSHVAGNCHTTREDGIMVHHYGPHIFNTSNEGVWAYLNRLGSIKPFTNRVKAVTARGVFSLPINLLTINQFFARNFSPREARDYILSVSDQSIAEPENFEEQALKFVGRALYDNFFYGYTKKQWGVEPTELPASILKRLPLRFSFDDNYYEQRFQGIPEGGYTAIVEKILTHPCIRIQLQCPFHQGMAREFDHVFCSGPIDAYFAHRFGRLRYRTLEFERLEANGDYQGNAVINYCDERVPYTRITEHKHFTPWESHDNTIVFREYSRSTGENDEPFYPLRLTDDKKRLAQYVDLATATQGLTFIGRLGTYRYLDMHVVIQESLEMAEACLHRPSSEWPTFPRDSV